MLNLPAHPIRGLLCGLAFLLVAGKTLGFGIGPGEFALLLVVSVAVAYLAGKGTRPNTRPIEAAAARNAHGSFLQNEHA